MGSPMQGVGACNICINNCTIAISAHAPFTNTTTHRQDRQHLQLYPHHHRNMLRRIGIYQQSGLKTKYNKGEQKTV